MKLLNLLVRSLVCFGLVAGCGVTDHDNSGLSDDSDPLFVWGTEDAPEIKPGPGAGEWNSERPRADNVMLARSAKSYLATSDARQRYGEDAAGSLKHYFDNDGADYEVSLPKLMADVPRIKTLYEELTAQVKALARTRAPGVHKFSMKTAAASSVSRAESENWYLTINGFRFWISGELTVGENEMVSGRITLHLWDRYDWDPGVVVPISTPFGRINIDQDRIAEFHRQGLAQEFDTVGATEIQL